jgi:hypothetical protein
MDFAPDFPMAQGGFFIGVEYVCMYICMYDVLENCYNLSMEN